MIITCPHCQTKYQVTFAAIGSAGRKVQCAHCQKAWDQQPLPAPEPVEDDRLFDAMAEDALDEIMSAEERAVSEEKAKAAPKPEPFLPAAAGRVPDAAEMKKRQAAFSRRQSAMISRLPLARLRRTARVMGVLIFFGLVLGLYFGREQIVERYPDLAGAYGAVGLGVNVVGLDFAELTTLRSLSGGKDVLMVSAQIMGLSPKPRAVPPVVVSLLDPQGHAVYEWSVVPQVRDLMAGERATFDTRLALPPGEATHVRLRFAGGNAGPSEPGAETAPAPLAEHAAPPTAHASSGQAPPAPATHPPTTEHH